MADYFSQGLQQRLASLTSGPKPVMKRPFPTPLDGLRQSGVDIAVGADAPHQLKRTRFAEKYGGLRTVESAFEKPIQIHNQPSTASDTSVNYVMIGTTLKDGSNCNIPEGMTMWSKKESDNNGVYPVYGPHHLNSIFEQNHAERQLALKSFPREKKADIYNGEHDLKTADDFSKKFSYHGLIAGTEQSSSVKDPAVYGNVAMTRALTVQKRGVHSSVVNFWGRTLAIGHRIGFIFTTNCDNDVNKPITPETMQPYMIKPYLCTNTPWPLPCTSSFYVEKHINNELRDNVPINTARMGKGPANFSSSYKRNNYITNPKSGEKIWQPREDTLLREACFTVEEEDGEKYLVTTYVVSFAPTFPVGTVKFTPSGSSESEVTKALKCGDMMSVSELMRNGGMVHVNVYA